MHTWPIQVPLSAAADVELTIFDDALSIKRVRPSTLVIRHGEQGSERLVGVSESADLLRFVPTFGERPLLIFPRPRFLCPAGTTLQAVVELPLHVRFGVGTAQEMRQVEELIPPTASKGLYGPVDAGTICTSIKAPTAPGIDDLRLLGAALAHEGVAPLPPIPELWYHPPGAPGTSAGDDPQMAPDDEAPPLKRVELVAFAFLRVHNATDSPLEVAKIMVPVANLVLYQTDDRLLTNEVRMRLVSKHEAELSFGDCPDTDARPVEGLNGQITAPDRKSQIFSYSYRNKTGLDYGF